MNFIEILFDSHFLIKYSLYKAIKENKQYISGNVLDFGCGKKPYKNLFNFTKYVGVDIEKSGHNHSDSDVDVFYDGKHLPFDDCIFDSIFSSEVFEHLFNIEEILPELNRVLKYNGILFLTCPFIWPLHEIPYDFARYTPFALEHYLKKYGFTIIKSIKTSNWIEIIVQLTIIYLTKLIFIKNAKLRGKLNGIINLFFIFPLTCIAYFLQKILPKHSDLYFNNIIIAKKEREHEYSL